MATRWGTAARARSLAVRIAANQAQVASRRQLIVAGVPRWHIRAEVAAGRWQTPTEQTVLLHNGPLSADARRWIAVLGTSPRAALDGVSALQQAGVVGLDDEVLHVITPRGSQPRPQPGVVVHESRRFSESDVITVGIRRTRAAVAAVHAALWAVSDRQAQLFLLMCAQQRLAPVQQLSDALEAVRRHPRRRLLVRLLADLAGGVQSLGELDVARDFRRRGFPEPERQVVRLRPSGKEYLDCELPSYGLVLEIDGAGHEQPEQQLMDLLRDLTVVADGSTTLRIPLKLYRLATERVLDRIEDVLVSRGWQRPAAA